MATKTKKLMAIALAIILCVNTMLMPVVALDAAIPDTEPTTVEATIIPPTTTTEPGPDDPQDANSITTSGSDTVNTWESTEITEPVENETYGTDEEGTSSEVKNDIDASSSWEENDTQYPNAPPAIDEENTSFDPDNADVGKETMNDDRVDGETSNSEIQTGSPLPEEGVILDMDKTNSTDTEYVEVSQDILDQLGTSSSLTENGEAETTEGEVSTVGDASYSEEQSEGYQEIPALQEQVGKDPAVTENEDGSTTTVSVTNDNNVYQRTTTTSKTVPKDEESVDLSTLSEEEQKALQEKLGLDPNGYVEEHTTTNYLTKNELANTETVEYEYQYSTDASGQITSITKITRTYDGTGADRKLLSVETDVENASTTKVVITTRINPVTQWLEVSETTETTIVEQITNEKITRTGSQSVQRVDSVTQNYNGTETTITLNEDEIFEKDGKKYFVIEGKMYEIIDDSENGDFSYVGDTKNGDTTSTIWNYDGGVVSGTSGTNTVLMKVVSKDGKDTAYVYCVEKNVNLSSTEYAWWDVFGVNPDFVYSDYEAVGVTDDNLRIVAENGYWNNAEGTNTLADLIAKYPQLSGISAAQAVAATQAALWHFSDGYNPGFNNSSKTGALYNILVGLTTDENYESPNEIEISASAITGTSVQLVEQVVENNVPTNNYKANVSIKMDVSESKLVDGDYIVELFDANKNSLGKFRLPGGSNPSLVATAADGLSGTQVAQVIDGGYVLNNVVLPNGQKFNIQISGQQQLLEAVRFTDKNTSDTDRQDLMGIRTATREVNLVIPMEINVATGNLQKSETSFTQSGTHSVTNNGTQTWSEERSDETATIISAFETITTDKTPVAYETMGQSEIVSTTVQKLSNRLVEYGYPVPDEGDDGDGNQPPVEPPPGGDNQPGGDDNQPPQNPPVDDGNVPVVINDEGVPLGGNPQPRFGVYRRANNPKAADDADGTIILDEEVPLADAPKTGDASTMLAFMSLASLGGLMVLSRKKEEAEA